MKSTAAMSNVARAEMPELVILDDGSVEGETAEDAAARERRWELAESGRLNAIAAMRAAPAMVDDEAELAF